TKPSPTPTWDTAAPSGPIPSPTASPTFTASGSTLTLGDAASDNVGVTQVTWTNSQGGSGIATGTTTWSTGAIALLPGSNTLTVSARDAAGNTGGAVLTVTVAAVSSARSAARPALSPSTPFVASSPVTIRR